MIEIRKNFYIDKPQAFAVHPTSELVIKPGAQRETLKQRHKHLEEGLINAGKYMSLEDIREFKQNPEVVAAREELATIAKKLNATRWGVTFFMSTKDTSYESEPFDTHEEALAWLDGIGLNLRPFPFKEKQEEECKND